MVMYRSVYGYISTDYQVILIMIAKTLLWIDRVVLREKFATFHLLCQAVECAAQDYHDNMYYEGEYE